MVRKSARRLTCGAALAAATWLSTGAPAPAAGFAEGFEAATPPELPAGWTAETVGGLRLWQTSTTNPDAGSQCATANPVGAVGLDIRLDSPPIPIDAADAVVQFRQLRGLGSADCGVLEIAIDGGDFTDIIVAGGSFLSGSYDANGTGPLAGRQAWCGPAGDGYTTTAVQLPADAAGKSVQFRWRLRPGGASPEGSAWRIDSVEVSGVSSCGNGVCGVGGMPAGLMTLLGISGFKRRARRKRR